MHPEQRNDECEKRNGTATSSRVFIDMANEFEDPDLMLLLHPIVLQTELRYKAECEASGVDYMEPKFVETKSQRFVRRRRMKYSIDPTLRAKEAKYKRGWCKRRLRKGGDRAS